MAMIGFNFTKINAERDEQVKGKISIKNNVSITDVEDAKIPVGSSEDAGIKLSFSYATAYTPSKSKIEFEGYIVLLESKKVIAEIQEEWKKTKKVPIKYQPAILNQVLNKCNIQAIIISRDLSLPTPVPLPKISVGKKKPEAK